MRPREQSEADPSRPFSTVVARAPGRANLIGEHLDYLGGVCLPIALELTTHVTVTRRDDRKVVLRSRNASWTASLADLNPGAVVGWPAYVAGVLWALDVDHGVEIDISTTLPVAAGLASSAALETSVALAVDALFELRNTRENLAAACHRAETHMVGAPTGPLDQLVALFALPGHALLADFADARPSLSQVPFRPERSGLELIVIDTRISHDLTDGGYGSRRTECEEAAAMLGVEHLAQATSLPRDRIENLPAPLNRRVRYVVDEMDRVRRVTNALMTGQWDELGALLTAGHASARDEFEISCAELDAVVAAACRAGALGARMTGGGFGGCAIALVPKDGASHMQATVAADFATRGWAIPTFIEASAGGAGSVLLPDRHPLVRTSVYE